MTPGVGESGLFADGWTVTEEKRRPPCNRNLSRSASTGASLRCAGRHSAGGRSVSLRRCASGSISRPPQALSVASAASQPSTRAADPADCSASKLVPGQEVCITGLAKAPELNGARALCQEWNSDAGRWIVCISSPEARTLSVRPENLLAVAAVRPAEANSKAYSQSGTSQGACSSGPSEDGRCSESCLGDSERRKFLATRLAVPRRRRLVEETLEVVRGSFDPAEGLAEAAAAAAREVLTRTEETQRERISGLAQPKTSFEAPVEENPVTVLRSRTEQQERCEELSRPRETPPTPPLAFGKQASEQAAGSRSVPDQQKRCAQLAQPRVAPGEYKDITEAGPATLNKAWEKLLAARCGPPPEGLREAKEWLASRACYFENEDAKTCLSSVPPSPRRCEATKPVADPESLRELRDLVEELLWMVLLQLRSVPKATAANSKVLEERLCNLLLSSVGQALRPVARKVIGPGSSAARRVRAEFPRLSMHLGFRESEELQPPSVTWDTNEIASRAAEVRACRDELLSTDLTKTLLARLGQSQENEQ